MADRKRWIVDLSVVDPGWANWDQPVTLQINPFRRQVIVNPAEALVFLHNRWPGPRSALAQETARLCSQVLRRRVKSEDARASFVAAAVEAGLLVTGVNGDWLTAHPDAVANA